MTFFFSFNLVINKTEWKGELSIEKVGTYWRSICLAGLYNCMNEHIKKLKKKLLTR